MEQMAHVSKSRRRWKRPIARQVPNGFDFLEKAEYERIRAVIATATKKVIPCEQRSAMYRLTHQVGAVRLGTELVVKSSALPLSSIRFGDPCGLRLSVPVQSGAVRLAMLDSHCSLLASTRECDGHKTSQESPWMHGRICPESSLAASHESCTPDRVLDFGKH